MNERDWKRSALNVALALCVATPAASPFTANAAAADCQLLLGFKALHGLDPSDVGDCTDNQAFAANGDALQHTSRGLLAWRKADNWTAFTDGYRTWLNGPRGLVSRLNTQRFPWESDYAAYSARIDPAFGPENLARLRTALARVPNTPITIDYLDSDFKAAAAARWPSGLLEHVMNLVAGKSPTSYFDLVDVITPHDITGGCPPAFGDSCWYVKDTASRSGSIIINSPVFGRPDGILTEICLKESLAIQLDVVMLNDRTVSDVQLLDYIAEQVSYDAALQYTRQAYPDPSLLRLLARNTLGQERYLASLG